MRTAHKEIDLATEVRTALRLYCFSMLGLFLLLVPWSALWDQVVLLLMPGETAFWLRSGWVRGAVSSLGILDLVVAYRDTGRLYRAYRAMQVGHE